MSTETRPLLRRLEDVAALLNVARRFSTGELGSIDDVVATLRSFAAPEAAWRPACTCPCPIHGGRRSAPLQ